MISFAASHVIVSNILNLYFHFPFRLNNSCFLTVESELELFIRLLCSFFLLAGAEQCKGFIRKCGTS